MGDVNVALDIEHNFVGDLVIALTHAGVTVVVLKEFSSCMAFCLDAVFDDSAAMALPCFPDISGVFLPANPLVSFSGADSVGDWTLKVSDDEEIGVTGTLVQWQLILSAQTPAHLHNADGSCSSNLRVEATLLAWR